MLPLFLLAAAPVLLNNAHAGTKTPVDIIHELQNHPKGSTEQLIVRMRLLTAKGERREQDRVLTVTSEYTKEQEYRLLIVFHEPQSVKGTRIITIQKPKEELAQWIYMPSLKKVNRIKSPEDMEGVLDSDLSPSDVRDEDLYNYSYEFAGDHWQKQGDQDCGDPSYAIEGRKKDKSSPKRMIFVSRARNVICSISMLGDKSELLKRIINQDFKRVGDRWRPKKTEIISYDRNTHKPVSKTELLFDQWKVGIKIDSKIFNASKLE
jgi:hypothetical protein